MVKKTVYCMLNKGDVLIGYSLPVSVAQCSYKCCDKNHIQHLKTKNLESGHK